ncbi:hypothetical protein [Lentzea sp. NPDC059081]|uniref:hypothetical protein n=1 Tax=Lentzea sp. NPDC059081 TaxID=3346719 RepID=UPI0036B26FD1
MKNSVLKMAVVGATAFIAAVGGATATASAAPASPAVVAPGSAFVQAVHFTAYDGLGRPIAGYDDNDDTFSIRYYSDGGSRWRWSTGCDFYYDAAGNLLDTQCL